MLAGSCTILPTRRESCAGDSPPRSVRLKLRDHDIPSRPEPQRRAARHRSPPMTPLEELRHLIRRHAGATPPLAVDSGIKVVATDRPSELAHHVMEPMLAVVAQGAKRAVLGE